MKLDEHTLDYQSKEKPVILHCDHAVAIKTSSGAGPGICTNQAAGRFKIQLQAMAEELRNASLKPGYSQTLPSTTGFPENHQILPPEVIMIFFFFCLNNLSLVAELFHVGRKHRTSFGESFICRKARDRKGWSSESSYLGDLATPLQPTPLSVLTSDYPMVDFSVCLGKESGSIFLCLGCF